MPGAERQQVVLGLLKALRGLDPLKQLFWKELNYQPVNQPLSRRGWSETAADALADDPLLFASGGQDNAFQIIYARLKSDKLLFGLERPVISRLLRDRPYALFVVSNTARQQWHFVNVKDEQDVARRRLFRRITVGKDERLCTAAERLVMLDLAGLTDRSPPSIQRQHDDAFDVEAVQKDFFRAFADLYDKVVSDISKVPAVKREAGRLAQLLLDRMLFLYFIQKKGWLDQKRDYLYSRFTACWQKDPGGSSYYQSVLLPLFRCLSNSSAGSDGVGDVPLLNGGLFDENAKPWSTERLRLARVNVKNSTFQAIFEDLLERFNFTLTEDTPLDAEVAIDPEMLGKIFESLILQWEKDPHKDLRKLTGSYYTPRPIVHFMCQEALKEYLVGEFAGEDEAAAARERIGEWLALPPADHLDDDQLARLQDLFTPAEARSLRHSVLNCRVCDPAVGSGAFPVAMLHEMVAAVGRLDARLHGREVLRRRNFDYELKRQVIESCLYGVDIQEQAVRLCELRLGLSLVVDYEIDAANPFSQAIREVPSLPNLSYRIVRGDSLLERLFGHVVQLDETAKDAEAKQLIDSMQADSSSFLWRVNFAEVFCEKGGFDVVLGNPPYVNMIQMDKVEGLRDVLRSRYHTARGAFDLFVPFCELAHENAREAGVVSLIVPNKILSAEYAAALRQFLSEKTTLVHFLDASKCRPFEAAVYPVAILFLRRPATRPAMIDVYRATRAGSQIGIQRRARCEPKLLRSFPHGIWSPILENGIALLAAAMSAESRLEDACTIRQAASVDEAYKVFKPLLCEQGDVKGKRHKQFLVSGTIDRYRSLWGARDTFYLKSRFAEPVLRVDHARLSAERLRQIESPKIILSGQALYPKAFLDESGDFASGIPTVLLYDAKMPLEYLCGLINSRLYRAFYRVCWSTLAMSGGYMRFGPPQVKRLPLPCASPGEIGSIVKLVRKLVAAYRVSEPDGQIAGPLEEQIDSAVLALFGIDSEAFNSAFADDGAWKTCSPIRIRPLFGIPRGPAAVGQGSKELGEQA